MKCSDIPSDPILRFLSNLDRSSTSFPGHPHSIAISMPAGLPEKLVLAKMRGLIRRGLVSGCACGCRGDFKLTEKGRSRTDSGVEP